jgi:3-phosphoshikimate 1-carboxyvinyltransferase
MDSIRIHPIRHPLDARVRVPGSKSLTNRALLVAALAEGTTRLGNALFSDDSLFFAQALQQLGFKVALDAGRCEMSLTGLGGRIPSPQAQLFIGNAGTAARFLSAFLTLGHGEYLLDGDERMRQRPIGDLVEALEQLGARIEEEKTKNVNRKSAIVNRKSSIDNRKSEIVNHKSLICPPLRILASGLPGGRASIAGDVSSQFLSAVLMVAPYAARPVELHLAGELNSKPYVEMTLAVMADFGVQVEREGYARFSIPAGRYRPCERYAIESDASAASYFFAAPAVLGGKVRVEAISRRSRQGDIAFLDVLARMGCAVEDGPDYIEVTGPERLEGVDVDLRDISDTAQTLAAIAPFAVSPTRLRGIAFIRAKESDRISATCTELARLGVEVEEHPDGMTIQPCAALRPATVHTYNDHRMAMAFALAGLRAEGVSLENPACVSKTFPDYFKVLESLR